MDWIIVLIIVAGIVVYEYLHNQKVKAIVDGFTSHAKAVIGGDNTGAPPNDGSKS
jgi:hypothetical protein